MESLPAIRRDRLPANERQLAENPATAYLARLGPGSRRSSRSALATLAVILSRDDEADPFELDWWMVRYQHVKAIRELLLERYAPATVNRHLVALRGVLTECRRMGLIEGESYLRAVEVEPAREVSSPPGRLLSAVEVEAVFAACLADSSASGARDAALFAAVYTTGLRRGQVAALEVSDYDREANSLRIGQSEAVPLGERATGLLARWLLTRGDDEGPLFMPITKSGRIMHRRMTSQAVYNAMVRRAAQAGIQAFSPESLRHTGRRDRLARAVLDAPAVQGNVAPSS